MDKPLDFSMNSCKEEDDRSKDQAMELKDPINCVSSKEKELKSQIINQTGIKRQQMIEENKTEEQYRRKQLEDELTSHVTNNQTRISTITASLCNTEKPPLISESLLNRTAMESVSRSSFKKIPYLNRSISEDTGIASKLLKDIIELQANPNARAKLSLEKQINAFHKGELLMRPNLQSLSNLNRESIWKTNEHSRRPDEHQPISENTDSALIDSEISDDNESKAAQDVSDEVKEFVRDKCYKSSEYNKGIIFPPNNLDSHSLPAISHAVFGGASNLVAEPHSGNSTWLNNEHFI